MPPAFCASAITCRAMVVLPEDSGPKISTTRPRGKPPVPRAASNEIAPVEITEIGTIAPLAPSFIETRGQGRDRADFGDLDRIDLF